MSTWLIPKQDLTVEQLRAIELATDEHKVVIGGPGSGKTQVLLHRARHLADEHGVSWDRLHVFVFTNVLSQYIQSALQLLGIPKECVSTFDDWCKSFYQRHISAHTPWNKVERQPDFDAIRQGVLFHVTKSKNTFPTFDYVLLDEGQDLDGTCYEILRAVSGHLTVCMDRNQQIYDDGSSESDVLKTLGVKRKSLAFLETFRCCPYIVQVAAQFIADPMERQVYIQQTQTAQTDIETPVLHYADDFEGERDRLIETLKVRIGQGERVAILLPLKRQVFGFAEGLREAGLEVETQKELNFSSDKPKLITFHSAKGLTFDTVLLPRLTAKSFPNMSDAKIERLLFVGLTRATRWVYLSATQQSGIKLLDRLLPLGDQKQLTVQYGSDAPPAGPETTDGDGSGDDLLNIF